MLALQLRRMPLRWLGTHPKITDDNDIHAPVFLSRARRPGNPAWETQSRARRPARPRRPHPGAPFPIADPAAPGPVAPHVPMSPKLCPQPTRAAPAVPTRELSKAFLVKQSQ